VDSWFHLPTPDWAGSLVNLALAIVSAGAALYSAAVVPWAAELGAAIRSTKDDNDRPLDPRSFEGAKALRRLSQVRAKDPRNGLGLVALLVSVPMTFFGIIGGLQIPTVGWLYTVVPVVIAAGIALVAAFIPGRSERAAADAVLRANQQGTTMDRGR
jgi:hypothetical protein